MDKKLDELSEEEFLNIMEFHSEAVTEYLESVFMISLLIILLQGLNTMHYLIIILKEL